MPIRTLSEMVDAAKVADRQLCAMVDNDAVYFFFEGDPENDRLELHPSEVQEQALHLLGINTESV